MKQAYKKRCYNRVFIGILVLLILCSAPIALARLGGGGRYGGGGLGGGSLGGGSSRGDGELIGVLIFLCIRHPYIGIPLILIFGTGFVVSGSKGKQAYQGRVIVKGRQQQKAQQYVQALAKLQARDPGFVEVHFIDRIREAFPRLQQAWCDQDLGANRLYLSDAVYERFNLQMNHMRQKGIRDHMENIQVINIEVAQLQSDTVFDTLTLCITASAIDYQVNSKTGKRIRGNKQAETFTEYWSFIRRPGAQTKEGKGLIEGNCPNCGDPLTMNEATQCPSCQSQIKSGEYDWVLAEITQAREWKIQASEHIPGVAQISQTDPGFSVQHIEDRASVMFWRTMESYQQGRATPLRNMGSKAFIDAFEDRYLKFNPKGERYVPDDVAVGAVEIIGVAFTETWDYCLVQIRWSAQSTYIDQQGKQCKQASDINIRTHVYILKRKHHVQSNVSLALSSAHCPGCGAPEVDPTAVTCSFCGNTLNDAATDWVLDGIELPYHERVRDLRASLIEAPPLPSSANTSADTLVDHEEPDALGSAQACAWLINVIIADGIVSPKERKQLYKYAHKFGITRTRIEDWLAQAEHIGHIETQAPQSPEEARQWLQHMVHMALIDGKVTQSEYKRIKTMGKQLGLTDYDVKAMINRLRRKLYQEARQKLRSKPQS